MKATTRQLAHRREIHAEAIAQSEARYGVWITGGGLPGRWLLTHNPDDGSPWVAESYLSAIDEARGRNVTYRPLRHTVRDLAKPPRRYKPRDTEISRKVVTSVRLLPEQIAALKLAGSMDKGITAAMRDAARYREALLTIVEWKFPPTGRFWDEPKNTDPMSYGACFGSNGERDYMREVARAAIDAELQRTPTEAP